MLWTAVGVKNSFSVNIDKMFKAPSERIEETQTWNFALIVVVADVLDGRRCSKHLFSITVDNYSKFHVKELKKLKVEILR